MVRRVVVVGVVAGALVVVGIAGRGRPRDGAVAQDWANTGLMAADFVPSFTTVLTRRSPRCRARPTSPLDGSAVTAVEGVVTARRTAGGRGVWIQDPTPDADLATSDAVFVFVDAAPIAEFGDPRERASAPSARSRRHDPDNLRSPGSRHRTPTCRSSRRATGYQRRKCSVPSAVPPTENIDNDNAGNVDPADLRPGRAGHRLLRVPRGDDAAGERRSPSWAPTRSSGGSPSCPTAAAGPGPATLRGSTSSAGRRPQPGAFHRRRQSCVTSPRRRAPARRCRT